MNRLKRTTRIALFTAALALACPTSACPVCSGNRIESARTSAWATLATTGAMVALPLGMVSGFALWLRKHL